MPNNSEFQKKLQRIEVLIEAAEALPDPVSRDCVRELIRAVLDLHRDGLSRLSELIQGMDTVDQPAMNRLINDEIVSSLLVLHELHPLDSAQRIRDKLSALAPVLRGHGYSAELRELEDN